MCLRFHNFAEKIFRLSMYLSVGFQADRPRLNLVGGALFVDFYGYMLWIN